MNSLKGWVERILRTEKVNLRENAKQDILLALNEPGVRLHWVESMIQEIQDTNVKVDRLMDKECPHSWESLSHRRKAILFCLNQILDSKDAIDYERHEPNHQNQASPFEGVAVTLD